LLFKSSTKNRVNLSDFKQKPILKIQMAVPILLIHHLVIAQKNKDKVIDCVHEIDKKAVFSNCA
jgi:hypothetical protein